jgi:hypothetical protein
MNEQTEARESEARLSELRALYNKIGLATRGAPTGEPDNSGKTIDDFLARALDFAKSGRILGIVGLRKHIRT